MIYWLLGWYIFAILFSVGMFYYASRKKVCPDCLSDPCMCDHYNCSDIDCKYFSVHSYANCGALVLEEMKEVKCPYA